MEQIKSIVYGLGGYDESKPNNNLLAVEYYTEKELIELAKEEAKAAAKADLLEKLGITAEEAKLLLS